MGEIYPLSITQMFYFSISDHNILKYPYINKCLLSTYYMQGITEIFCKEHKEM